VNSEITQLPLGWTSSTFAVFDPFVTSGSRGWAKYYSETGDAFIRITNMTRDQIALDLADLRYVRVPDGDSEGFRTSLRVDDILISITADIGIVGLVDEDVPLPAYINQHIAVVRFPAGRLDSKFVAYSLATTQSQKRFRELTDAGAKAGMSLDTIRKLEFLAPQDTDEQKAIAQALSDIDDLIASLDALMAKKRDIKQGAMQQLLTGTRRLPGFSGGWGTFEISEVFDILRNGSHARATFHDHGEVYCAHYGAIHATDKSHVAPAVFPRLPESSAAGLPFVQNGDLLLTDASEDLDGIGKSVEIIQCDGHKVVAGLHTVLLRPKPKTLAPGYAGYLQFTADFKNGLLRIANGISVYGVAKNALRQVEIKLPDFDEQVRISEILLDLQAEIVPLEDKRTKLNHLRQGMMQQLLTGRIRLK
jgi:type I restriction enzyme S subunit